MHEEMMNQTQQKPHNNSCAVFAVYASVKPSVQMQRETRGFYVVQRKTKVLVLLPNEVSVIEKTSALQRSFLLPNKCR
jgi:hypothetical protein